MTADQIIAATTVTNEEAETSKGVSEMLASIQCSHLVMILIDEPA